jgi:hypothetical protein
MAEPSPKEFQPYRKVQGSAELELRKILELTAKRIQARIARMPVGIGGVVRAAQLKLTLVAIHNLLAAMWSDNIDPLVARSISESLEAAESAVEALERVAYASLSEPAAEELVRGLKAAAASGLKSDAARRKRDLSRRVYHQRALDDGKVEQMIRQGLISGLSAKELAADVYRYVSPGTKGGASYAAMRLARTEINNAFHERQIDGAKRPGVQAVKWNLSGSHRVPDLCNVYAGHGGNGEWPVGEIPEKPHPNCFCYLTYVMMDSDDFQKALAEGKFDDEIDRRTRENLAALGQPVGDLNKANAPKRALQAVKDLPPDPPLTGKKALDSVPKGLFKRGSMTKEQRAALQVYESGWFVVMNNTMRRGELNDPGNEKELRDVMRIDSAMDESLLPSDIQAWRGMFAAKQLFGDSLDGDLTGFTWEDQGYGSTTTNEEIVDRFNVTGTENPRFKGGNVKMKVMIPAGTKALATSTFEQGSKANGPQAEITLQHGMRWTVVKDNGVIDGVRNLEVRTDPIG